MMKSLFSRSFFSLAFRVSGAVAIVFLSFATSRADTLGVLAQSGSDIAIFQVNVPNGDSNFDWKPSAPVGLYTSTGVSLGSINELSLSVNSDPQVVLGFGVTAASSPATTTFTIFSSTLSFAPIVNGVAFTSAGITVTDNDGNGATLSGLFAGGNAYSAVYNGGLVFSNLIQPTTAAPTESTSVSDRTPTTAPLTNPIAGVSSIQNGFYFTLTANDSASGTSKFSVEPVPEATNLISAALIAGSALLWSVRRRRGSATRAVSSQS